jgi:hypothetical protein
MRCATAEGKTLSYIAITAENKQVDIHPSVITIAISPLKVPVKLFCFTRESLRLRKEVQFIFELLAHIME